MFEVIWNTFAVIGVIAVLGTLIGIWEIVNFVKQPPGEVFIDEHDEHEDAGV